MKTPYLFGKGPSFVSFLAENDVSEEYTIGVNEAAFIVPNCKVAIALDNHVIVKLCNEFKGTIWLRDKECARKGLPENVVLWDNKAMPSSYETAACALWILHSQGHKAVNMVGFDNLFYDGPRVKGKPYPKEILAIDKGRRVDNYYGPINKKLKKTLRRTGIVPAFLGLPEEVIQNGTF